MEPIESIASLERVSGSRSPRRKILLVCEGYRTEVNYFEDLKARYDVPGSEIIFQVVVLERYFSMSGISDPERLARLASDYIRILEDDIYTTDLLIGRIQKSLVKSHVCSKKDAALLDGPLRRILRDGRLIEEGLIKDPDAAFSTCSAALYDMGYRDYELSDNWIDYDRDRDIVCLVVDRDSDNGGRSAEKYRSFLAHCRSQGYRPFISNPRFEFWILMHFDITGMDDDLKDPLRRSGRLDSEMRARGIGKKSRFEDLVGSLDMAIANSWFFQVLFRHRSPRDRDRNDDTGPHPFDRVQEATTAPALQYRDVCDEDLRSFTASMRTYSRGARHLQQRSLDRGLVLHLIDKGRKVSKRNR